MLLVFLWLLDTETGVSMTGVRCCCEDLVVHIKSAVNIDQPII